MNGWTLRKFRGTFRRLSRDGQRAFVYDAEDLTGRLDIGNLWIDLAPGLAPLCVKGDEVTFEAEHRYFPQGIVTESGRRIYHKLRIANLLSSTSENAQNTNENDDYESLLITEVHL